MVPLRTGRVLGYCPRCRKCGEGAGVLSTVPGRGAWGSGAVARSSLRMGKGQRCCVHSTSPSRSGQWYCPWYLSQWEGAGVLCLQYFTVGRVGYCVHNTSHSGRGGDTVSTVPLTVGGVGESGRGGVLCPQYLTVGRVGLLCPQYLSPWEGWGRVGGVGYCVHSTSHCGTAQGSRGARSRPLAPGGAGSGRAASCQAHHTASPFAVSRLALPASILWHLFQKACLPLLL